MLQGMVDTGGLVAENVRETLVMRPYAFLNAVMSDTIGLTHLSILRSFEAYSTSASQTYTMRLAPIKRAALPAITVTS